MLCNIYVQLKCVFSFRASVVLHGLRRRLLGAFENISRHSGKPLSDVHRVRPKHGQFNRSSETVRKGLGAFHNFCLCLLGKGRHDGTRGGVRCCVLIQYLLIFVFAQKPPREVLRVGFVQQCWTCFLQQNAEFKFARLSRKSTQFIKTYYDTDEQSYSVLV